MTAKTVNGGLSTAPLSNAIEANPLSAWQTTLFLMTLGILGVVLHASLRIPLHLPGHHGLEWMALLSLARATVPRRWATSVVGIAAAAIAFLPVWAWHDAITPLIFLASAMLFDALCAMLPKQRLHRTLVALAGGLAFSLAGLISYFAGPHGLSAHATWELWSFSHFGFALLGTLVGIQLGSWTRSRLTS